MIMKSHTHILLGKGMVALHVTTGNRDFMIYQNQASYEDILTDYCCQYWLVCGIGCITWDIFRIKRMN